MQFIGPSGELAPQMLDEIYPMLCLMREEKVDRYLEIGLSRGDTFCLVGSFVRPSLMVGVDLPVDLPSEGPDHVKRICAALERTKLNAPRIIWGDSHDARVAAQVAGHAPYDFVFIDGDHTEEGVRADWENYGKMARIVAFHDIVSTRWPVPTLWREIREHYPHRELLAKVPGLGIGVLWREQ